MVGSAMILTLTLDAQKSGQGIVLAMVRAWAGGIKDLQADFSAVTEMPSRDAAATIGRLEY